MTEDHDTILAKTLSQYYDVNAPELSNRLAKRIHDRSLGTQTISSLQEALRAAIDADGVTPAAYKKLTGDNEYITQAQVNDRLSEIYLELFGS